jgi:hypothetical protein
VAIGPAELNLAEGNATLVHAIGSAQQQTLSLVPLAITGLHSSPSGVPAGTPPAQPEPGWWLGLGVVLAALAAAVALGLARRPVRTTR